MQFLDAAGRKDLQKFAKEYGIKANIKSDEIREQLLKKGFTAPGPSNSQPARGDDVQPENQAPTNPKAPSSAETKLQGLQSRMKMRRNALHVRNGASDSGVAPLAEDASPGATAVKRSPGKTNGATKTPVRNRSSTTSNYYTPAAGEIASTSCATVFGTPAQTLEPVTQSSKTPGSRGIPSSPPPPPPHLATPVSKQAATQQRGAAGIPGKRVDVNKSTPSMTQPAPGGQSYLPRSPVNSVSGEAVSPQPLHQGTNASPEQPINHIADVPATAAALKRLKNARTGNRPPAAVPVPSHLLASTSEHISQDPMSQPPGEARIVDSKASPTSKKGSNHPKHGAPLSPVSAGKDEGDLDADAVRGSNSNVSAKGARRVPVHLKKKSSSSNTTGATDHNIDNAPSTTDSIRDTLGLAKRRKAAHVQPGRTTANATVPQVPSRSMRSQPEHSAGSHKAKSLGAGAKGAEVPAPIRISRSPPPKRGFGGQAACAKSRIFSDRAGRRSKLDAELADPPPRRSISVEPKPHTSRSAPRGSRGSGNNLRSSGTIRASSDGGALHSTSLSKESSKTSVATSGNSSAPGSVAAGLLGGSLADRIGRSGVQHRDAVPPAVAAPPAACGSGLPRRSLSPAPAPGAPSPGAKDAKPRSAAAAEASTSPAQLSKKKGAQRDVHGSVPRKQASESRLPRLSPSPSPSPTPNKQKPAAHHAAFELQSAGFVFPSAAVREASADTPTFADEGDGFAFGAAGTPAGSPGLRERQEDPHHSPQGVSKGSKPHESRSRSVGRPGSNAASHPDEFTPPKSPPERVSPKDAGPKNSGAANKPAGSLARTKSGRSRVTADEPLPSQHKNRMRGVAPAPPPQGPSLAEAAAVARARRVSDSSGVESRGRVSSTNGNDALLAQYASTDMSSDAGGLSRVNTESVDPAVEGASGASNRRQPQSPLAKRNAFADPAAASTEAADVAAGGRHYRGTGVAAGAQAQQRSVSAFAADRAAGTSGGMGGSSFGTSGGSLPAHSAGHSKGTARGTLSAFDEAAGRVSNTSGSDFDGDRASGKTKGCSTKQGLQAARGTASALVRSRSASEMRFDLAEQPRMQQHRNSRLEDTALWLTMRSRELHDLESTMHELNQIAPQSRGASGELPGPDTAHAAAEMPAGNSNSTPHKGRLAESASMVQRYAEMEAELAQLPNRRRHTSVGPPQSRVSMSMDGFLMAERLANGGRVLGEGAQKAPEHGHSASMPGQSALDRAQLGSARSSAQFTSSDGSSIGVGSSYGSGGGGIPGLAAANRALSRSPMGRVGKPSVGSMLSPLPEKGKWAEPARPNALGNRRTFGSGPGPAPSAVAESLSKNARQGLRAPKAGRVGVRARSANPAPFRGASTSEAPAGLPRGLKESSRVANTAGVLAEPPRSKPSDLTQSMGAGRGPGRVASAGKMPARMGGSVGTGVSAPSSPYLASPVAAKSGGASRARSAVGALRTPTVKPRGGTMACNRNKR